MKYQLARNGQTYGPYSLDELRQYLASGNVQPTDLAVGEGMTEWEPVAKVLGLEGPGSPVAHRRKWQCGLTGMLSGFLRSTQRIQHRRIYIGCWSWCWVPSAIFFLFVWIFVQASWVKTVDPKSKAMAYYGASIASMVLGGVMMMMSAATQKPVFALVLAMPLIVAYLVLLIMGHFDLRRSLEEHFNGPEPVGLRLSGAMTFFFNTVYFQYHINRIHEMRRYAGRRPY